MLRPLPVIVGIVVVLGSGIAHGLLSDRWEWSDEPRTSAERLKLLDMNIEDWEGQDGKPIKDNEMAMGRIKGAISRNYKNRLTSAEVSALIVCGRPGPIGVHTPDVCWVGGGMQVVSMKPVALQLAPGAEPTPFVLGQFKPTGGESVSHTRVLWTWLANGQWVTTNNPRIAFARLPALYKVYIVRQINQDDEPLEEDPIVDFAKVLLPEMEKKLIPAQP
jgi:hypothetical protein